MSGKVFARVLGGFLRCSFILGWCSVDVVSGLSGIVSRTKVSVSKHTVLLGARTSPNRTVSCRSCTGKCRPTSNHRAGTSSLSELARQFIYRQLGALTPRRRGWLVLVHLGEGVV